MNDKITLTLNAGEAILVHEALTKASGAAYQSWNRAIQTDAPDDEQAIAKLTAVILNRACTRLADALYPPCRYALQEDCERPVVADGLCAVHQPRVYAA